MAVPAAPTALVATPTTTGVSIAFSQEVADPVVTNYEVSLDGGAFEALDPADDATPIVLSGLTDDTAYSVALKAVNLDGASAASTPVVFRTVDDKTNNRDGFNLPTVFANPGQTTGNLDWNDPDD
jgi:hypothetical protein